MNQSKPISGRPERRSLPWRGLLLAGAVLVLGACPVLPSDPLPSPSASPAASPAPSASPVPLPNPPADLYDYSLLGANIVAADTVAFALYAPRAAQAAVQIASESGTRSLSKDPYGIWRATVNLASPAGTRYRFVLAGASMTDPYGKAYSWEDWQHGGWSIIADPAAYAWGDSVWTGAARPSIDQLVVYELHIKDFTADANDPGPGADSHYDGVSSSPDNLVAAVDAGSYAGLIAAIPYLSGLGVNAVELMPPSEFNDGGYSWGYNTQSFFAPESGYSRTRSGGYPTDASVAEFQALVDAFHQAGIAVIADMVFNHIGNDQNAFWAIDSGYYFDYDGNGSTANDSTPWGNHFNTKRPMVKKLMYDAMRYFAEELHVDGFRLDATSYVDHDALKEVAAALQADVPGLVMIAEQLPNASSLKGSGIAQWSDLSHDKWKAMLKMAGFSGYSYDNVDQLAAVSYYSRDGGWTASPRETVNYFESHDENSLRNEMVTWGGRSETEALAASRLGAMHLFTALGTPLIMAGQEFLREREGQNTNEWNGRISWSWQTGAFSADGERRALHDYYRDLIGLRKAHPALRLSIADPVGAGLFRWSVVPTGWGELGYPVTKQGSLLLGYALNASGSLADDRFVVVLNYGTAPAAGLKICFPAGGTWTLVADGSAVDPAGLDGPDADAAADSLSPSESLGAGNGWFASYDLPARSGLVFKRN